MQRLRRTSNHRVAGIVCLLLGVLFVMTGLMKLAVPILALAWSGQLLAAGVPLYSLVRWTIPFAEMLVGVMLMAGAVARVASLLAIGIMIPATYVHVVVEPVTLSAKSGNDDARSVYDHPDTFCKPSASWARGLSSETQRDRQRRPMVASADTNKYGLQRRVPAPVKRRVRQECRYGCVLCCSGRSYSASRPAMIWSAARMS